MNEIARLFSRRKGKETQEEAWVPGSGLVFIPQGRSSEIPNVIAERHLQEVEWARVIVRMRRV